VAAVAPAIDHISTALVRAFAFMVQHPGKWYTVPQLVAATGASSATVYRRFGNLVAARALSVRQVRGFRQFRLHPQWAASPLGAELAARAPENA